jgi:Protein of unknown function (DUF1583)
MTISRASQRPWTSGWGFSGQSAGPGLTRRRILFAVLSIILMATGRPFPAIEAGQGEQTGSTPAPANARLAVEFHQDFRGVAIDPRTIRRVGGYSEQLVRPDRDGLRVRIPAGLKNPDATGVAPRCWVHGDFEISVSFTIVKADTPIRGYGVAATLWAQTDTPTDEAVTIERGIIPREGERFTSTRISGPPEARKYDVRRAPAESRSGKLRMERMGSKVTTSFADGKSPFRALRTVELGTEDITLVRLAAETGVSDHAVEILLEDLTIRAEALPGLRVPARAIGGSSSDSKPRP